MAEDFENLDENLEEENDLIELIDEEGEPQTFELLGSFELNDNQYLAVADPIEEDDPESVEVFILKIVTDEDGNDSYVSVDNDEADEAFEYFLTLVDSEEE
ncbi:MAG: DUF1292 domain-containing protein [Clostridia bacterium]|nr:DUF1292 domain-containing protein [Clostridia bacterium]